MIKPDLFASPASPRGTTPRLPRSSTTSRPSAPKPARLLPISLSAIRTSSNNGGGRSSAPSRASETLPSCDHSNQATSSVFRIGVVGECVAKPGRSPSRCSRPSSPTTSDSGTASSANPSSRPHSTSRTCSPFTMQESSTGACTSRCGTWSAGTFEDSSTSPRSRSTMRRRWSTASREPSTPRTPEVLWIAT